MQCIEPRDVVQNAEELGIDDGRGEGDVFSKRVNEILRWTGLPVCLLCPDELREGVPD